MCIIQPQNINNDNDNDNDGNGNKDNEDGGDGYNNDSIINNNYMTKD